MNTPKANFQTAADLFDTWRDDVLTGSPPVLYRAGTGELEHIEIGPKLVTLIGGGPGSGKTAFTMQCLVDALRSMIRCGLWSAISRCRQAFYSTGSWPDCRASTPGIFDIASWPPPMRTESTRH